MKRPAVKTKCVADSYARGSKNERIVEVYSHNLQLGCLVSVREHAGYLFVEVYSADAGVIVRVGGRDVPAERTA